MSPIFVKVVDSEYAVAAIDCGSYVVHDLGAGRRSLRDRRVMALLLGARHRARPGHREYQLAVASERQHRLVQVPQREYHVPHEPLLRQHG